MANPDKIYNASTKRWVLKTGKVAAEMRSLSDLNDDSMRTVMSKLNNDSVRSMYKTNKAMSNFALQEKNKRNIAAQTERLARQTRAQSQNSITNGKIMTVLEELYNLTETLRVVRYEKHDEAEAGQIFLGWNGDELPFDDDNFIARLTAEHVPFFMVRKAFAKIAFDIISKQPLFKNAKVGDVVRFETGERNRGVVGLYDGKIILELDTDSEEEGNIPKQFVVFEPYPPTYWMNAIDRGDVVNLNMRVRNETIPKIIAAGEQGGKRLSYSFKKKGISCKILFRSEYPITTEVFKETLKHMPLRVEAYRAEDMLNAHDGVDYVLSVYIYQEKRQTNIVSRLSRLSVGGRRRTRHIFV